LGGYHHFVDSLHLYDQHTAAAASLPADPPPSPQMPPIGVAWEGLSELLAEVLAGRVPPLHAGTVWAAFAAVLASYRVWTGGDREQARSSATAVPGELGRALDRWYDRLTALAPAVTATGLAR
jgi:thymidylate synthase